LTCASDKEFLQQTISTLRFGQFAKCIKNKIRMNREISLEMLKQVICELETQVNYYQKREKERLNDFVQPKFKEGYVSKDNFDEIKDLNEQLKSELDLVTSERNIIRQEFARFMEESEESLAGWVERSNEWQEKYQWQVRKGQSQVRRGSCRRRRWPG
jgi:hypothetical protein